MINEQYFIFNVIALTLGTIIIRGSFIALSGKFEVSQKIKDLFSYIPAAILPALIIPASFYHQGHVNWLFNKERFFVMLIAIVVSYFVRNTLFIISFGLILLYLVSMSQH